MKIGKIIASFGLAICLINNCFALTGESEASVDTVGGKLEIIFAGSDQCFDCRPYHIVLDGKNRILGGERLIFQKLIKVSPEKDWLLITDTCGGNSCREGGIDTVLEISKDKKWKALNITESLNDDANVFRQGENIIIEEEGGWKITISPELQILKKEISFTPIPSNNHKKQIKRIQDLKGLTADSILELPFIKKDLQALGLYPYLLRSKDLSGDVDLEKDYVISISYRSEGSKWEPLPSYVVWATIKNKYYILLPGFMEDFLIVSNLKQTDIRKLTKEYLSDPAFEWGISEASKCYINSDTRSVPCMEVIGK